jgi:hypothetical protein
VPVLHDEPARGKARDDALEPVVIVMIVGRAGQTIHDSGSSGICQKAPDPPEPRVRKGAIIEIMSAAKTFKVISDTWSRSGDKTPNPRSQNLFHPGSNSRIGCQAEPRAATVRSAMPSLVARERGLER